MKKIIGGEFQIDDCLLNLNKTSKNAIVLSSGRCALSYILKNIEKRVRKSLKRFPHEVQEEELWHYQIHFYGAAR